MLYSNHDMEFIKMVKNSYYLKNEINKLGYSLDSKNIKKIKETIKNKIKLPRNIEEYLNENKLINKDTIKKKLISEGIFEEKCSECNIGNKWNGRNLLMQIDHINGIHNDNRLSNLRLLCANCLSQVQNKRNIIKSNTNYN